MDRVQNEPREPELETRNINK